MTVVFLKELRPRLMGFKNMQPFGTDGLPWVLSYLIRWRTDGAFDPAAMPGLAVVSEDVKGLEL